MLRVTCALGLVAIGCTADRSGTPGPDALSGVPDSPDAMPDVPDARPVAYACAPDRTAGHQTYGCPDGVEIDVEAPEDCVDGGCGVILDVHGYTMSADVEDAHTRMRALGTARGYIVVQPTAPGAVPSWGIGELDGVVWDALVAVTDVFDVDPDRVHVSGFSQGGMMSYRLLCAHAPALASIAPVAGGGCFTAGAQPAVEVPILYIHGHKDTIVSWYAVGAPQRDAVLAAWEFGAPVTIGSGDEFLARRWTTASGTDFEMWEHDFDTGDPFLAGHCLPGPDDGGTFRCDGSEFDQAAIVLDFFDAHPR